MAGAKRGGAGGREKGKKEGRSPPPLPNPPPLFPFLPIPCPLPLSTPATQASFCPMKITITQFSGGFRLNSPSRKTTYTDFRLQLFPGRKVHVMTTHDTITQQFVLSIGGLHILSLAYTEGREDRQHPGFEHEQAFTSFRKISTFAPNI